MTLIRRRNALLILVVSSLVVWLAVALIETWDLGAYRSEIARRLSAATGRTVAIEGAIGLDLGFRPALVIEGISIGNVAGGSRPSMATVGRLEVSVRLLPLLTGELQVHRLLVADTGVLLERDANGRGNWLLDGVASGDDGGGESDGGLQLPGEFQIRASRLIYRDQDQSYAVDIQDVLIKANGPDGSFDVAGRLTVDEAPLSIAGKVEIEADGYAVHDLRLAFRGSDLNGDLALSLEGGKPKLTGNLQSRLLDLTALQPAPVPEGGDLRKEPLFPETPLPRDLLTMADAELSFAGDQLRLGPLNLRDVTLQLRLADGRLRLEPFGAWLADGRLDLDIAVDARQPTLAVAVEGGLKQADFGVLMRRAANSELFTGKLDAKLAVAGEGKSPHELAASADGDMRLLITEGSIDNRYVDYLAADLLRLLLPGSAEKQRSTAINCFVADFGLKDGTARSQVLLLDTERMIMAGEGTIDLDDERVDLYLEPRPKDPSLLSIATPIIVRGPLSEPGAMPDPAALGKNAAVAVLGNVLLPGVGLLLPFLDSGAGNDHPCIQAVKSAPPVPTVPEEKRASDGIKGGIKDGIEGVIEGIGEGASRGIDALGKVLDGGR